MRFPLTKLPAPPAFPALRHWTIFGAALMLPLLAMLAHPASAAPPKPPAPPNPPSSPMPPPPAAAPPATAPPANGGQAFPFPVTERTLANGLQGLRRRLRLAWPGRLLFGRPHRQPQRGRAGQVRLRALLRAPDVPRQREIHGRQVHRRHQGDGRRLERLHLRRPDRLSHPRRQGGLAQDRRDRSRPLPAPAIRGREVPEGSARRAGRIQQERLEPDPEAGRDALRQRLHDPHVQAHDDGLPEGHREHAQGARLLAPVLRSLLPSRKRHPPGRRRRRARSGVHAGREALRRLEAGRQASGRARRAAAEAGEAGGADLEGGDAAAAARGLPRARVLDDQRRRARRWTCWPSCCSPSARRCTSSWSSRSRRSRRCRGRTTRTSIPTCSRCSRASRSRPTSPTSKRRSTTRWAASPAKGSTRRRWRRCCRTSNTRSRASCRPRTGPRTRRRRSWR